MNDIQCIHLKLTNETSINNEVITCRINLLIIFKTFDKIKKVALAEVHLKSFLSNFWGALH